MFAFISKYGLGLLLSIPVLFLSFVGDKSNGISFGISFIILVYFWVGILVGENIKRD